MLWPRERPQVALRRGGLRPQMSTISSPLTTRNIRGAEALEITGSVSFSGGGMTVPISTPQSWAQTPNSHIGFDPARPWWLGLSVELGYDSSQTFTKDATDKFNFAVEEPLGVGINSATGTFMVDYSGSSKKLRFFYAGAWSGYPTILTPSFAVGDMLRLACCMRLVDGGVELRLKAKYGTNAVQTATGNLDPAFIRSMYPVDRGYLTIGCSPYARNYGDYASGSTYSYFTLRQEQADDALLADYITNYSAYMY